MLRVARRAWLDVGLSVPDSREEHETVEQHVLLRKFFSECCEPERIDRGELLRQVRQLRVFRIRAGDWRAATWYDHEAGVLWLLRARSLAKYPTEDKLYESFGDLERRKQLLPSSEELLLAAGAHHLASQLACLGDALARAYEEPGSWQRAECKRPNGDTTRPGRVYIDQDGELVSEYVVLNAGAFERKDVLVPRVWREHLFAALFANNESVARPTGGLPPGADLKQGEIPLVQIRAEEHPPDWVKR